MKKLLLVLFFCILVLLAFASCNETINSGANSDNLFKKNHTVTLVVDDMTNKKITVDEGEVLNIAFTPRKDSCIFKGWYTDSACTVPYDLSRPVTTSFKLYAAFALRNKTINCENIKIKGLSSTYDDYKSFNLSLVGFDYDYLEKNGLGLQFKIVYDVKYIKDYNVPLDIGYAGSPKYEVSLINDSLQGFFEEDLSTTKTKVENCYTYNTTLNFSKDGYVSLVFSTDNVQNIISFTDIVIFVEVIRLQ